MFLLLSVLAASADLPPYRHFQISDAEFDHVVSAEYEKCMDKSGGRTFEMRECSAAEFKRLDAQLNAEYREAMSRSGPRQQGMLRRQEREWLKNRWRECDRSAAEEKGGSLALTISDGCGLSEMARRILWLKRYGT